MVVVVMVSGCANKEKKKEKKDLFSVEENQEVNVSYNWEIKNYKDKKIDYKNEAIKLNIAVENDGDEIHLGPIIFIDGIAQRYSLNNKKEYCIGSSFKKGKKVISVEFEPQFGDSNKKHEMYVGMIYEPDYRTKKGTFGHKLNMAVLEMYKVVSKSNVDYSFKHKTVESKIPDNIKREYKSINHYGIEINKLENTMVLNASQDNKIINERNIIDTSKNVQFNMFGGESKKYRVCALKNNKPIKIFGSQSYIDVEVKNGMMTSFEGDFSKEKILEGDVFYLVYCPIVESGYNPDEMFDKSDSFSLK